MEPYTCQVIPSLNQAACDQEIRTIVGAAAAGASMDAEDCR